MKIKHFFLCILNKIRQRNCEKIKMVIKRSGPEGIFTTKNTIHSTTIA